MKSPLSFLRLTTLAGLTAALCAGAAATSHAQTFYSALTPPAAAQTGVQHYMQLITPPLGAGTYSLNSVTLGVNLPTTTANQGFAMYFYNNVNTSPTAASAITSAPVLGISGNFSTLVPAGNQTVTVPFATPLTLTLTGTSVGVEIYLLDVTNPAAPAYSDDANGRFSAVAPTVGSAASYVWNDANFDGIFTGAEQTTFGQTGAYTRLALNGIQTVPLNVPEPGTWAMLACGLGLSAFVVRRRLA